MKNIEKQLNSTLFCVFKIQRPFYSHESKNNFHPSEISKNLNSPISDRIKVIEHFCSHKSNDYFPMVNNFDEYDFKKNYIFLLWQHSDTTKTCTTFLKILSLVLIILSPPQEKKKPAQNYRKSLVILPSNFPPLNAIPEAKGRKGSSTLLSKHPELIPDDLKTSRVLQPKSPESLWNATPWKHHRVCLYVLEEGLIYGVREIQTIHPMWTVPFSKSRSGFRVLVLCV